MGSAEPSSSWVKPEGNRPPFSWSTTTTRPFYDKKNNKKNKALVSFRKKETFFLLHDNKHQEFHQLFFFFNFFFLPAYRKEEIEAYMSRNLCQCCKKQAVSIKALQKL